MAEYDYSGDPSTFPTPKSNTNGSGTATFFQNSFQPLVDRTAWLKANAASTALDVVAVIASIAAVAARVSGLAGGAAGASVTRRSSLHGSPVSGTWTFALPDNYKDALTTGSAIYFPLSEECAPHGARLTGVSVVITPDPSHGSLSGLVMPQIGLFKFDANSNVTQIGATTPDPSNLATYNTPHSISITGLTHTIDRSLYRYAVLLDTEHAGANAIANTFANSASATVAIL